MPFAAFKLMRLMCRMELPGRDWDGWCISAGKLYTPEGHGLSPHDAKWWSLLVQRAEDGRKALLELARIKRPASGKAAAGLSAAMPAAAQPHASAGPQGLRRAAPLDLSIGHFATITQAKPPSVRFGKGVPL